VDPILDIESLRRQLAEGKRPRLRFFYGHRAPADGAVSDACFSQWWTASFTVDGQQYVSAEQFMMAEKARLFGDHEMRARILATTRPADAKKLGRGVSGFDEAAWVAARFDIVTAANVAKFDQDPALRRYLLDTGEAVLVEASPTDRIWGIGLKRDDPRAHDPGRWLGLNLLGFALVRSRAILRGALPAPRS
jgi:ribA/ribD-fused uncharacterized protein